MIKIMEVGPRDGLQNEAKSLNLAQKKKFIELLIAAGHKNIEVGAFVSPQKIPQMAGSFELIKDLISEQAAAEKKWNTAEVNHLQFDQHADLWALVPNERGFQDAVATGIKNIAVFTAASETFNQKNINTSIDGSFERFETFVAEAQKLKMKVRGYVSTCFGCPYEGKIDPKNVLKVTERLLKMGVYEVSIGDTIGVANPKQVSQLVPALIQLTGVKKLALHFHDTRGTALANVLAGLEAGVKSFDSSAGGLGGCPYAPGASGNLATDDLVYMLEEMGLKTGIDLKKHVEASLFMRRSLGKNLPSRYLEAAISAAQSSEDDL